MTGRDIYEKLMREIAATAFKTLLARIRYPTADPREIFPAAPLVPRQSARNIPIAHGLVSWTPNNFPEYRLVGRGVPTAPQRISNEYALMWRCGSPGVQSLSREIYFASNTLGLSLSQFPPSLTGARRKAAADQA